jgi:hypothetical protein
VYGALVVVSFALLILCAADVANFEPFPCVFFGWLIVCVWNLFALHSRGLKAHTHLRLRRFTLYIVVFMCATIVGFWLAFVKQSWVGTFVFVAFSLLCTSVRPSGISVI